MGVKWLERSETVRGLYVIAVDVVKRTIYDQLQIPAPGDGYVHIPAARDYLWVEQLTAERCAMRKVNGVVVPRFELPSGKHNEALDCRVYARAVVEILRPDWNKIEKSFLAQRDAAKASLSPAGERSVERLAPEAVTQQTGPAKPAPASYPRRHDGTHPLQKPREAWYKRY